MRTTRSPYLPYNAPRRVSGRQGRSVYSYPRQMPGLPARRPVIGSHIPAATPLFPRRVKSYFPWSARQLYLVLGLLFGTGMLAAFLLVSIYGYFMLSGRILPGVFVGQNPAGIVTEAALLEKLDAQWNQQQILLTDGTQTWAATAADLGLRVNAAETAARAYDVGRGPHALAQMLWLARFGKIQVEPVVALDPAAARGGLKSLSSQINQPAQNAALQNRNGQWAAVPGQFGSSLNIDETLRMMAAQPAAALMHGIQPVVINPVSPQVMDLTPLLDRLQEAIRRPLTIEAYDPITDETIRFNVPEERMAGWITIEPQGEDIHLGINGSQLETYLQEWASTSLGADRELAPFNPPLDLDSRWQNQQALTMLIAHKPTLYTVAAGDTLTRIAFKVGMPYYKIQQANPGIDANELVPGQDLVIPSKNEMLPLPVVRGKRVVISIGQQHMWTYENGALRSEHVISTGIDRSPTIPGIYQIQTHDPLAYASVWDLTMPHFMGIYEGWPGFMNGIHGLPTLSNGQRLWSGSLGRPVSYGCIILGLEEAEDLYQWADEGVIVEIQP